MALGWLVVTPAAYSVELVASAAQVDEGSDYLRPAANLKVNVLNSYYGSASYWGRSSPTVRHASLLASGGWILKVSASGRIYGTAGFAVLAESVKAPAASISGNSSLNNEPASEADVSYAPGASLGVGAQLLKLGALTLDANWTSHIFPAGLWGALFLAHDRRQMWSMGLGVEL